MTRSCSSARLPQVMIKCPVTGHEIPDRFHCGFGGEARATAAGITAREVRVVRPVPRMVEAGCVPPLRAQCLYAPSSSALYAEHSRRVPRPDVTEGFSLKTGTNT